MERYQIKAFKRVELLVAFTDIGGNEVRREVIELEAGQQRGDIAVIFGIDHELAELESQEILDPDFDTWCRVPFPHVVGETTAFYDLLEIRRLE